MPKESKKSMDKELMEAEGTVSEQIETINEKIQIIKRSQGEILDLKSTISEKKRSPEGFNSRSEQAEKSMSERK